MANNITQAWEDFPLLKTTVNDRPLVYLDNAATTQKPQLVLSALQDYYCSYNANIHRGNHSLSMRATEAHEKARAKVAQFLNAEFSREIIFTRGTTEAVNLVAYSFGQAFVRAGDEILTTQLEHHSNYVPWQLMAARQGATFRVVPLTEAGELDLEALGQMLNKKTRILAVNHVSNSLGTVNPIRKIIEMAHAAGVPVLVDGAQSVQHLDHDLRALDADFFAFSGHKIYAPMGIGVLYGKEKWLDSMPPFLSGGEMIDEVRPEHVSFNVLPYKFEAGTPNVEGAIGLGVALDYLAQFDPVALRAHEEDVLQYGLDQLAQIPGLTIYGHPAQRSAILPFNVQGLQHYDLGLLLDSMGIAVRTGQHCTQPIMDSLGVRGTVRASLALYSRKEDIDALVKGILRAIRMLRKSG